MVKSIVKKLSMILGSLVIIVALAYLVTWTIFIKLLHSTSFDMRGWISPALGFIAWVVFMTWYFDYCKKHGGGNFKNNGLMSQKDFKKMGNKKYMLLSSEEKPKGWIVDARKSGDEALYKHYMGSHMLVYGMSRSGKTAGFVLGTIFANAHSSERPCFIITDPKGELYELTNQHLRSLGYRVWKLDVAHPNKSNRINPLTDIWDAYKLKITGKDEDEIMQAKQDLTELVDELVASLIPEDATKGANIWTTKGRDLWNMMIYYNLDSGILMHEFKREEFTLVRILEQFNRWQPDEWIKKIDTIPDQGMVHLYKSSLSAAKDAAQTFEGIKANASMATSFISNASVQKLTSATDIDLKTFVDKPTVLYIIVDNDRPTLKNIANIYLRKIIAAITRRPERDNNRTCRPVYIIGDEIGNIPPIFNLGGLMTTCLYKRIYCMLVFQDRKQLYSRYGEDAETIGNNCDLSVIIKIKNIEQAKEWSSAFGTFKKKKINKSKNADGKISTTTMETEEQVLPPQEILEIAPKVVVWFAGKKVTICNRVFLYETKWYQKYIKEDKSPFIPMIEEETKTNDDKFDVEIERDAPILNGNEIEELTRNGVDLASAEKLDDFLDDKSSEVSAEAPSSIEEEPETKVSDKKGKTPADIAKEIARGRAIRKNIAIKKMREAEAKFADMPTDTDEQKSKKQEAITSYISKSTKKDTGVK